MEKIKNNRIIVVILFCGTIFLGTVFTMLKYQINISDMTSSFISIFGGVIMLSLPLFSKEDRIQAKKKLFLIFGTITLLAGLVQLALTVF